MNSSIYKRNIESHLSRFYEIIGSNKIKFIYGGATVKSIEERKDTHISSGDCDSSWIISAKAITTIQIKNKDVNNKELELKQYDDLVSEVEQYLIDKLGEKYEYDIRCRNDKNKDGTMAQRGGAGIREKIEFGNSVKIYILYKLKA